MQEEETLVESLIEKVEQYSKTTAELFKLKTIGKTADVASSFMASIIIIIFIVLFLLITSIGAALWMGEILGKPYNGFFFVAAVYVLIISILYILRRIWLKKTIKNAILNQSLK